LKEAKLSAGQTRPFVPPFVGVSDATPPVASSSLATALFPPSQTNNNNNILNGGGIQATTTPSLNVAVTTSNASSTPKTPTSVEELFNILNGILRDLGLTSLTPAAV
jgi:hypothetical protein